MSSVKKMTWIQLKTLFKLYSKSIYIKFWRRVQLILKEYTFPLAILQNNPLRWGKSDSSLGY